MIDSLIARRRWCSRLLAAAGLALALLSAPAHAAWDVDQLMQALAQNKSGRATFVEKKYIAMLDKPVESSGELLFIAPDRLEKRTVKPKPESMVLEGNTLTLERGRRQYVLALQDYPELGAFTESIRGTLAGDQKALARIYNITLEGSEERWTLTLRPIEPKMAAAVQRVVIHGSHADLRSIEIEQADKDRSVMTITSTTPP
ncbi:MAG: outer-membrane lipoprotein carrier protein LolA [Parasulfuritortus sp.]|nr:outer-membrane lipoprotein carrier protein LolA [Parasulfuritortus sp.]